MIVFVYTLTSSIYWGRVAKVDRIPDRNPSSRWSPQITLLLLLLLLLPLPPPPIVQSTLRHFSNFARFDFDFDFRFSIFPGLFFLRSHLVDRLAWEMWEACMHGHDPSEPRFLHLFPFRCTLTGCVYHSNLTSQPSASPPPTDSTRAASPDNL